MAAAVKPKLLVVELWGVGDLAIATPFLCAASRRFEITVLAKPHALEIRDRLWPAVQVEPWVAPWTAFQRKYFFWRWPWRQMFHLFRKLRGQNFEFAVSARRDPRDHLAMKFSGAKTRIGFLWWGTGPMLNHRLAWPGETAHRYELWRMLGERLGVELPPHGQLPAVPTRRTRQLVVVHTGARIPVRVWPLSYYAKLVQHLRQDGFAVQVICDSHQQQQWQQFGENEVVSPRSLKELLDWLDKAAVFIGNCSGPGHLAAISGVPTFTFFGPSVPAWFAPLHPQAQWVDDRSCPYKPCRDYCRFPTPRCLENITEESAWSRIQPFVRLHAERVV